MGGGETMKLVNQGKYETLRIVGDRRCNKCEFALNVRKESASRISRILFLKH